MAEQQQNGGDPAPRIPEGAEYLFVTFIPKTGEYAIVFSSTIAALALHSMAATSLEKMKRDAIAPETPAVSVAPGVALPPGFDLSKLRRGH